MTPNVVRNLLYPVGRPHIDGGFRLRLALEALAAELMPDSDDAGLAIQGELGWSGVRSNSPPTVVRAPLLPRAAECRRRLGAIVGSVYPDAIRAAACFYRRGVLVGAVELPLRG